jgi:hypothetical protein
MHAGNTRGGDIVPPAHGKHLGAGEPRGIGPGAERDGQHHDRHRGADDADEGERQQEARHDLEGIDHAHQRLVGNPSGKARRKPHRKADRQRRQRRGEADEERGARAMHDAGQDVAAEPVGAERKGGIGEGRRQRPAGDPQRIAGEEDGRQQREKREQDEDGKAGRPLRPAQHVADKLHAPRSAVPTRGSSAA